MEPINSSMHLSYLPIRRYEGSRSNFITSAYAGLYEMVLNSFGKESTYLVKKQSGHSHLDGRGDIHHRNGGVLSISEHAAYVEKSDSIRLENNKRYSK